MLFQDINTHTTVLQPLERWTASSVKNWEHFVEAKFYSLHAVDDDNLHIWINEKMLDSLYHLSTLFNMMMKMKMMMINLRVFPLGRKPVSTADVNDQILM